MPIFWLDEDLRFPNPELANEDGIIAIGGDLSSQRLLLAYELGIFPWFNPGDPIIWWSPNPRCVLFPADLKISKSMRPIFNQKKFTITLDKAFPEVMKQCSIAKRKGQDGGTWITDDMYLAYCKLHDEGAAHSVEVWQGDELVGGLYGIAIGKIFFGESMFSNVSNASKAGFISLVQHLIENGFKLIDCQQETPHLKSLGASLIPRSKFLSILEENQAEKYQFNSWHSITL